MALTQKQKLRNEVNKTIQKLLKNGMSMEKTKKDDGVNTIFIGKNKVVVKSIVENKPKKKYLRPSSYKIRDPKKLKSKEKIDPVLRKRKFSGQTKKRTNSSFNIMRNSKVFREDIFFKDNQSARKYSSHLNVSASYYRSGSLLSNNTDPTSVQFFKEKHDEIDFSILKTSLFEPKNGRSNFDDKQEQLDKAFYELKQRNEKFSNLTLSKLTTYEEISFEKSQNSFKNSYEKNIKNDKNHLNKSNDLHCSFEKKIKNIPTPKTQNPFLKSNENPNEQIFIPLEMIKKSKHLSPKSYDLSNEGENEHPNNYRSCEDMDIIKEGTEPNSYKTSKWNSFIKEKKHKISNFGVKKKQNMDKNKETLENMDKESSEDSYTNYEIIDADGNIFFLIYLLFR